MRQLLTLLAATVILAIYHPKIVIGAVLVIVLLCGLTMIIAAIIRNGG